MKDTMKKLKDKFSKASVAPAPQEPEAPKQLTPEQQALIAIATCRNLIVTDSYTLDKLPQVNAALAFLDSLMQQVTPKEEGAPQ